MRIDGRDNQTMRKLSFEPGYVKNPDGAVLTKMGNTVVLCTATIEEGVPSFLKGAAEVQGWITAEYNMLPGATSEGRFKRERGSKSVSGRTQEIQRLIGRSLRGAVDLKKLGARSITLDCDVIQADGGTRTTSINGAFIALSIAIDKLMKKGLIAENPILYNVGAISCGVYKGEILVDLCYEEDSKAEMDMNIVMTSENQFLEIQGTAEHAPFTQQHLSEVLTVSQKAIKEIVMAQNETIFQYLTSPK